MNLGLSANPKTGDNYPEVPSWREFVCELLIRGTGIDDCAPAVTSFI